MRTQIVILRTLSWGGAGRVCWALATCHIPNRAAVELLSLRLLANILLGKAGQFICTKHTYEYSTSSDISVSSATTTVDSFICGSVVCRVCIDSCVEDARVAKRKKCSTEYGSIFRVARPIPCCIGYHLYCWLIDPTTVLSVELWCACVPRACAWGMRHVSNAFVFSI